MILYGSDRGPVALPVFKTGCCPLAGQDGFDSHTLPPTLMILAADGAANERRWAADERR